ncbi:Transposon Tf2-1 polyprotein [Ceratobasidium sp. AG-Ba]|nr:Transposon Tf2-1 polyprotein [Ceratobasidium sp. AG-Ba]
MQLVAQLPKYLWVEAFRHACYLKNRTYTHSLVEKKTPYELMYGVKPDVSALREFGSPCWVLDQSGKNTKLDPKSHKSTFVGIDVGGKAWRYWSHEKQTVLVSRNVKFPPTPQAKEPDSDEPTARVPVEGEGEPESEPAETEPAPAPAKAEPTVTKTPSAPTKVAALLPLSDIVERSRRNLPPVPYDPVAKHGKTANPNARFDAYGPYVSDSSKREASNEAVEDYAHVVSEDTTFDDAYSLLVVMDLAFEAATDDSNDKPSYHVAVKGVDRELWREATEIEVAQLKAAGTKPSSMAMSYGIRHALWLRTFLAELGFEPTHATPVLTNSRSAIALAQDSQFHGRSKHIDIRHYFIREHIENDEIVMPHVAGVDNLADGFTKPVLAPIFSRIFSTLMTSSYV